MVLWYVTKHTSRSSGNPWSMRACGSRRSSRRRARCGLRKKVAMCDSRTFSAEVHS